MLDIKQLQVFLAVWEHRNISRAAQAVYLTQPTVSGHLKALEEQLGTRLFDRTSKKVAPTQAARVFYPYAKQIMDLNRQALEEMKGFLGEETGTLEIGASNIPGQYLLPPLLGLFKKIRPKIEIKLEISDTRKIVESVENGMVEIGLVGAKLKSPKVHFEECFSDELVFVAGPAHQLLRRKEIELDEMVAQPLITREGGSGTRLTIERALREKGVAADSMNIVVEMGSTEAVRQAVKAGIGCAIISKRAVKDDLECGLLQSIKIKGVSINRTFYLIWLKNRTLSPVTKLFISFLRSSAQSQKQLATSKN